MDHSMAVMNTDVNIRLPHRALFTFRAEVPRSEPVHVYLEASPSSALPSVLHQQLAILLTAMLTLKSRGDLLCQLTLRWIAYAREG
jgi:hypothetical protein